MVCIYCAEATKVTNSRPSPQSRSTWRRRECSKCRGTFTTKEQADYTRTLRVKKSSGDLEPFQRDKLFLSLYQSLTHRKSAIDDAGHLTNNVITKLLDIQNNGLIDSIEIKHKAMYVISHFDQTASFYYQAHYCRNNSS